VKRLNGKTTSRGIRAINEFKRLVKSKSVGFGLILITANYWIKKYRFLPDSIQDMMDNYLDGEVGY